MVICPTGDATERRLLGLSVGERLLLALAHAGVGSVHFCGPGPRPRASRAAIDEHEGSEPPDVDDFVVLTADAVFDRRLVQGAVPMPEGVALRRLPVERWNDVVADPERWLTELGPGRAGTGEGFVRRVVDQVTAREVERSLLLSLRKPIDGFVSRHLNRYVSITISRFLVRTGVSPNVLTVVFMIIGLSSGLLAAVGEPWWVLVLGATLFQAQSILDGCDGEISRLTYRFSKTGQWLDSIGDDLTNYAFCFGLAVGQARVQSMPWLYAAGGVTLLLQLVTSGILYRRMILLGTGDLLAIPDTMTGGESSTAVKVLRAIVKRDVFVLVIAVLTAVQLPVVAFLAYAGGTIPMFVGVVLNDLRLSRAARS